MGQSHAITRRIPHGARRRISTTAAPAPSTPVGPATAGHPLRRRVPILPPAERWDKIARLQGPHICPREELEDNPEVHYHRAWSGGGLCGRKTVVKLDCCFGYGRVAGETGCPLAKPLETLMETAKLAGAKEFVELHETTGLTNVLASANHDALTLLAPTDYAMKKVPPKILEELRSPGPRNLTSYREGPASLLFHMIPGRVDIKTLPSNSLIPTLYAEQPVRFNVFPNGLVTADCIPLVEGSLEALEGVVHTLQSPLRPLLKKGDQGGGYSQTPARLSSLVDTVARDPKLRRFSAVLAHAQRSSASPLLQHSQVHVRQATLPAAIRPMTLLAPTDDAFDALPVEFLQSVLYDQDGLSALISNHLFEGILCSATLGVGGAQRITRTANNGPVGTNPLNGRGFRKPPHMLKTLTGSVLRAVCEPGETNAPNTDSNSTTPDGDNSSPSHINEIAGNIQNETKEQNSEKVKTSDTYKIGDAVIIKPDIMALDGVIHVIDRVIIPKRARPLAQISSELGLNVLLSLLPNTGLQSALMGRGSLTLFAPSDKAFKALPNSTLDYYYKNPQEARILLLSHITSGRYLSSNLVDMQILHSRYPGRDLRIKVFRGSKMVESGRLLQVDAEGSNGVLHIIDQVLIPPEENIADYLRNQGNYTRFLEALSKTSPSLLDLIDTPKEEKDERNGFSEDQFTVFAVTDEDIDSWASDLFTFDRMIADQEIVNSVMRNHVIHGVVWTKAIEAGGFYPLESLNSGSEKNGLVMLKRNASGEGINVGNAQVIDEEGENGSQKSNIHCTNGVVHRVNRLIQVPNPFN